MKCKTAQKYETQQCTLRWDVLVEHDSDFYIKSVAFRKGCFWEFSFVEHAAFLSS